MQRPTDAPISSAWGWRTVQGSRNFHSGIDFARRDIEGAPVSASAAGTVIGVYPPPELQRYGLAIVIKHDATPAPLYTLYAHLQSAHVSEGERVQEGQTIATVGDTAGTRENPDARTGRPHLHFEFLTKWPPTGIDLDRIDPTPYLTPYEGAALERHARAGIGGGLLLLGAALWYLRNRQEKRRRQGVHPADARPTDATGGR